VHTRGHVSRLLPKHQFSIKLHSPIVKQIEDGGNQLQSLSNSNPLAPNADSSMQQTAAVGNSGSNADSQQLQMEIESPLAKALESPALQNGEGLVPFGDANTLQALQDAAWKALGKLEVTVKTN
jgi:hypothetical protein